jgi:hypothetical protein
MKHISQSESSIKTKHTEHFTPPASPQWLTTNYKPRVSGDVYLKPTDIAGMCTAYPASYNLPDLITLTFETYIIQVIKKSLCI